MPRTVPHEPATSGGRIWLTRAQILALAAVTRDHDIDDLHLAKAPGKDNLDADLYSEDALAVTAAVTPLGHLRTYERSR